MIREEKLNIYESPIVYETVDGVNIPVDRVYNIHVNGVYESSIVAMPTLLQEAGIGYAALRGYPAKKARISIAGDRILIETRTPGRRAYNTAFPGECGEPLHTAGWKPGNGRNIDWEIVRQVIRDFGDRTASRRYRVAAHTVAFYTLDGIPQAIVHDTSRHTAMLKLIGLKSSGAIRQKAGIIAGTGRASADIVYAAALAGARLIVTLRGPLASGYRAAKRLGITLVVNARTSRGREFKALTGRLEPGASG